jgi:hypothetical protein
MRYGATWPVEDRDFVNLTYFLEGEEICWIASSVYDYPYPKQEKVTRGICHIGGWILKKVDNESTYCIYISDADLEGSIPHLVKKQQSEKQAELPSRVESALKNK